jgi:uncharacterized protein (TIGR02444 family)
MIMGANLTDMQQTNPFWQFSQQAWKAADTAGLCLQLQQQHDCDVNLLLWLGWRSAQGEQVTTSELEQMGMLVEPWRRQVILPLRGVRNGLGKDVAHGVLRERLLAAELEAERIQQELMFNAGAANGLQSAQDYCAGNARAFCAYAGLGLAIEQSLCNMLQSLQSISAAVLPCD